MKSAVLGKTAAFVAGIAVALGGAALYVHAHRPAPPPQVQTANTLPDADQTPQAQQPAEPAAQPAAAPQPDATPARQPDATPAREPERQPDVTPAAQDPHRTEPKTRPAKRVPDRAPQLIAQDAPPPDSQAPAASQAPPLPNDNPYDGPAQAPQTSDQQPAPDAQTPPPAVQQQPPVVRKPRTVTLPPGTTFSIRLNTAISSDTAQPGDSFSGTLDSPIISGNALIAERGSRVEGKVTNVQRGNKAEGGAELSLVVTAINTTDGQHVPVQTTAFDKKGPAAGKQTAERVGGGAALGAIIGAIAGGGRGAAIGAGVGGAAGGGSVAMSHRKAAVLEAETRLNFQFSDPVTITEKLHDQ